MERTQGFAQFWEVKIMARKKLGGELGERFEEDRKKTKATGTIKSPTRAALDKDFKNYSRKIK